MRADQDSFQERFQAGRGPWLTSVEKRTPLTQEFRTNKQSHRIQRVHNDASGFSRTVNSTGGRQQK
ncbi:MAG: hypothetical protein O2983_07230 [Planctomycetota bacterium]|nr:hypothetical protein [Planctomycetota bacterium]MDA1159387.1 hypothetical protein [Planctomycetota bacterium]